MSDYPAFGKIPRLHRDIVITEKIDGTNGLIAIEGEPGDGEWTVRAGSRNRWLTSEKGSDNHGFARWVEDNKESLVADLGLGLHYGEWWGEGIGKRYRGHVEGKCFSLFNVHRWADKEFATPNLCVVPVLARAPGGEINDAVMMAMYQLRRNGSVAAPGCFNAEGIIVFHTASNYLFKATLEKDEEYKGANRT